MRAVLRRRHDEAGFTLIELLVVIVIVGILAGIAIPVYLEQRKKGYDASAKSDLRNLADFEEIYLTDFETYGSGADLMASEPRMVVSAHDHLTILFDQANGYCLSATPDNSTHSWYYDSLAGGLQPSSATHCPTDTSAYTDGGSL